MEVVVPDISMCQNKTCKDRFKCYRFTATPADYQSYTDFKPVNGDCENFWDNEK